MKKKYKYIFFSLILTLLCLILDFETANAAAIRYPEGTILYTKTDGNLTSTILHDYFVPAGSEVKVKEDVYYGDSRMTVEIKGYPINPADGSYDSSNPNNLSNFTAQLSLTAVRGTGTVDATTVSDVDDSIGKEFDQSVIPTGEVKLKTQAQKIWNTVLGIIRVLAFSGIIFAGVRYIYASADQKADLKKSLIPLVIGMVLVFASTIVIEFVRGIFSGIVS